MAAPALYRRIREIADKRGMKDHQICVAAGITTSYMSSLKSGRMRSMGAEKLAAVARALGVPVGDLLEPESPRVPVANHDQPRDEHAVVVPVEAVVVGGSPGEAANVRDEDYTLLHHLYRPGRRVVRIYGDSMWPTYHSGDLLLVEPTKRLRDGKVGLVRVNGESTVKRVYGPKKGKVVLRGDNPTFPPIVIEDGDDFEIVGEILGIVEGKRP